MKRVTVTPMSLSERKVDFWLSTGLFLKDTLRSDVPPILRGMIQLKDDNSMISLDQFKRAADIPLLTATKWYPHLASVFQEFGIDDAIPQAQFIAQVAHESAGFSRVSESFNYSVDGLRATFGKRITFSQSARLGRQTNERTVPLARQMEIANLVYGGRYGNGPEEGWEYRGRGLKQVTFKDNYAACGKALGIDLVAEPDLLLQDKWAALSAGWFWSANGLSQCSGDTIRCTKIINGGLNGLDERKRRFALARSVLVA